MSKILVLTLIVLLQGCVIVPTKRALQIGYVDKPHDGKTLARQIELDLTRGDRPIIAYYGEAVLLTPTLIEAKAFEQGRKNGDSEESIRKTVVERQDISSRKRVCFNIDIKTGALGGESLKFSSWKAKVTQNGGEPFEIYFGTTGTPKLDRIDHVAYVALPYYSNSGVACSKQPADWKKGFTLSLIPQFGGQEFVPIVLEWGTPTERQPASTQD
jgi:hypothetical protein